MFGPQFELFFSRLFYMLIFFIHSCNLYLNASSFVSLQELESSMEAVDNILCRWFEGAVHEPSSSAVSSLSISYFLVLVD